MSSKKPHDFYSTNGRDGQKYAQVIFHLFFNIIKNEVFHLFWVVQQEIQHVEKLQKKETIDHYITIYMAILVCNNMLSIQLTICATNYCS
jgi:hypothetical protein